MPINVFQLAQEEFERSKSGLQQTFESEWTLVNNKYGRFTKNTRIENARSKELAELHQHFKVKANEVSSKFNTLSQQFLNVDKLAQEGAITGDPNELKLRLIMPSEANKFLRASEQPKSEIDQFSELSGHEQRIRRGLEQFEVRGPTPDTKEKKWYKPWFTERTIPGTSGDSVYIKTNRIIEQDGEQVYETRPARKEELREWATLTNELQQVSKLKQNILSSNHFASRIQRAAYGSNRMVGGGTLAKDVIATKTGQTPPHTNLQEESSDPLGIR